MPIDPARFDLEALAARFRAAEPFHHVVLDGFLRDEGLGDLAAAFDEEPAEDLQDEICDVLASRAPPEHPALRGLYERMGSAEILAAVEAITGERVTSLEMRAYAYLPGRYLLPHADSDAGGRRRVAYAIYVSNIDPLEGGELDLYRCDLDGAGEIVETTISRTVEPRPGRCVLFGVSPQSLHRVREVTSGGRLSLAGWFLR